jgi:polyisoprenoid-binding protein YceI
MLTALLFLTPAADASTWAIVERVFEDVATAVLNRHDFGVSWNQALEAGGMLMGSEVELRIDAEFVRSESPKVD